MTKGVRYSEEFKKNIVAIRNNSNKSLEQLSKDYGVSITAICRWIRDYSEIKTNNGEVMTLEQVKKLQKRNALLEEENSILKKAIAIFTPHSNKD